MNLKYSMCQRGVSHAAGLVICQSSKLPSMEMLHIKLLILEKDRLGWRLRI